MRTIRASEIGSYLYCKRAWWYQRQGVASQNQTEMSAGSELHARHGQSVLVSGCLQTAAYVALLLGLGLLVFELVRRIL